MLNVAQMRHSHPPLGSRAYSREGLSLDRKGPNRYRWEGGRTLVRRVKTYSEQHRDSENLRHDNRYRMSRGMLYKRRLRSRFGVANHHQTFLLR